MILTLMGEMLFLRDRKKASSQRWKEMKPKSDNSTKYLSSFLGAGAWADKKKFTDIFRKENIN